MTKHEQEMIDALLKHPFDDPFPWIIEESFPDPENQRALFLKFANGLTFHITVKLVQ